jgi:hypothetical protein
MKNKNATFAAVVLYLVAGAGTATTLYPVRCNPGKWDFMVWPMIAISWPMMAAVRVGIAAGDPKLALEPFGCPTKATARRSE